MPPEVRGAERRVDRPAHGGAQGEDITDEHRLRGRATADAQRQAGAGHDDDRDAEERDQPAGELEAGQDVGAGNDGEERRADRSCRDQQRRVTGRDRLERRGPDDLVDPEP